MSDANDTPSAAGARDVSTVVVSRAAHPARVREFERALARAVDTALRFPGQLGITVLKPPAGARPEYKIVIKFDSQANRDRWYASEESRQVFAHIAQHESRPPRFEMRTGLESWFETDLAGASPPPRHKIALATWLAAFPVITFWSVLSWPLLGDAPLAVRAFVLSGLMTFSLAYVVMPRITRWLAGWLFAERGGS